MLDLAFHYYHFEEKSHKTITHSNETITFLAEQVQITYSDPHESVN